MLKRLLRVLACAVTVCAPNVTGAQSPKLDKPKIDTVAPHILVQKLADRIYTISEVGGDNYQRHYDDAVSATANDIRLFVENGGDPELLTQRNTGQQTPLMSAAYYGYAPVVEELLKHPSVASSIDAEDKYGTTAWEYAMMALRQSMPACNPMLLNSPFKFIRFYVTQEFYASKDPFQVPRNPYPEVRALLERNGAAADMQQAREQWHSLCKAQGPLTRKKIDQGDDLQAIVIAEGQMFLQGYLNMLKRKKR